MMGMTSFQSTAADKQKQDKRPNVLWIYLEDVSGWFSCYGDNTVKIPNMDKMANEGIRFDRYYATAGVCSASRSAVVTGMMQTTIGAHNHRSSRPTAKRKVFSEFDRIDLPKDVIPLPIMFREAGYYTFNEGGKDDYNFMWSPDEFYDYVRGKGGWAPKSFLAGDCLKGNTKGKPWFGQLQLGGGKLRNVPASVDRNSVPVFPYYPDVKEVREEIAYHYDCIEETDKQVGQIIDKLKEMGELENTMIFLFSDHGMRLHRHKQFLYEGGIRMPFIMQGPGVKQGVVDDQLISGIDISATSLAVAGIDIPKGMEGENFLSKKWKGHDYVIAARDRCDFTIEKIRTVVTKDFKYLRNYLTDRPFMQPSYKDGWPVSKKFREMMRNKEMNQDQLVFFGEEKPAEELYDLANDPDELHNLANDPKYSNILKKHQQILEQWINATDDKGQYPESEIGLRCIYEVYKNKCVNPEYDVIKQNPRNIVKQN
ncbi:DUF229 domain-containing protein [Puteibacter caeruleilacunae]|nr:DUF229 domain-containing protein [Puteibacter caeruleilacunae]